MPPPIKAIREYGRSLFIRAYPHHLMESPTCDRVSAQIDRQLYAVIAIEEMEEMLETG